MLSGKDAYSGRSNDGHTLLLCLLDQLPREGLRDTFSYDGNGPDLEDENSTFLLTLHLRWGNKAVTIQEPTSRDPFQTLETK